MKIASVSKNLSTEFKEPKKTTKTPSFKSGIANGILTASGNVMQGIESKGFLMSFLIQDGLGMTFPRILTGFHRDKEITGQYNIKEGIEVSLRECLTGPFMVGVAPFFFFLAGKYCKSARTNTRLTKIIGDNFSSMLKSSNFNQAAKNDKSSFKKEFYKYNLEKFYKSTVPNDKESNKTIEYLVKELDKYTSKDKKVSEEAFNNMLKKINDKITETSTDLADLCSMSIDAGGKKKGFTASDVVKAVANFGEDAIENNPNFKDMTSKEAENIKNNFAAKRLLFNITNIAVTLTGLSILPKIYARSDVAPGAVHLVEHDKEKSEEKKNQELSFKGKGINSDGIFSKIGKFLTQKVPEWFQREFEYNGYNFTPSLMLGLSVLGLILPRSLRAYNRAYIDEHGKRDWSEVNEILVRDSISSMAVVYTIPILQKSIVGFCENGKGFVLTNKASMNKSKGGKFLDIINPYSKLKVLSNAELMAMYSNIDSQKKMVNFAKFIDEKGGDLQKILSHSKNAKEVFTDQDFTLDSIESLSKSEKNKKIISFFEGIKDKTKAKELVVKLMNDNAKGKQSNITKMARGLNSVPGFIVTVFISPIILGCLIPMLTYANTRKAHAKMIAEGDAKDTKKSA